MDIPNDGLADPSVSPKAIDFEKEICDIYDSINSTPFLPVRKYRILDRDREGFFIKICAYFKRQYRMDFKVELDKHPKGTPIYMGNGVYSWNQKSILPFFHELGHYLTVKKERFRLIPNYGLGNDYMGGEAKCDRYAFPTSDALDSMELDACIVEWLLLLAFCGRTKKWRVIVRDAMIDEGFANMNSTRRMNLDKKRIKYWANRYGGLLNNMRYAFMYKHKPGAFLKMVDAKGKNIASLRNA